MLRLRVSEALGQRKVDIVNIPKLQAVVDTWSAAEPTELRPTKGKDNDPALYLNPKP